MSGRGSIKPGVASNHDGIGDGTDDVGRNVRTVLFPQEALYFLYRHSSGVQSDDLVVKAGEASGVLRDQQGRKTALPVARYADANGAFVGQYRPGAVPLRWLVTVPGLAPPDG